MQASFHAEPHAGAASYFFISASLVLVSRRPRWQASLSSLTPAMSDARPVGCNAFIIFAEPHAGEKTHTVVSMSLARGAPWHLAPPAPPPVRADVPCRAKFPGEPGSMSPESPGLRPGATDFSGTGFRAKKMDPPGGSKKWTASA